jgi:hypothetical protein
MIWGSSRFSPGLFLGTPQTRSVIPPVARITVDFFTQQIRMPTIDVLGVRLILFNW